MNGALLKNVSDNLTRHKINRVTDAGRVAHEKEFSDVLQDIKNLNKENYDPGSLVETELFGANQYDVIEYYKTPVLQRHSIDVGKNVANSEFYADYNIQSLTEYAQRLHMDAKKLSYLRVTDPSVLDSERLNGVDYLSWRESRHISLIDTPSYFRNFDFSTSSISKILCSKVEDVDIGLLLKFVNYYEACPIVTTLTLNYTLIVMVGPNDFLTMCSVLTRGDNLHTVLKECIYIKQSQIDYASFKKKMPFFGMLFISCTALLLNSAIDPTIIHKASTAIVSEGSSSHLLVETFLNKYSGTAVPKFFSSIISFIDSNDSTNTIINMFFKKK